MRGFRKNIREIALFLTCVVVMTAHADVKLRIYMQDGTLQAGNLISESKDTFVILTKEGRLDVPKKLIMFVNGKTLKQWEQKPDKLFSTEIIPNEIPNPAFVNERTRAEQATAPKIPILPEIKSVMPSVQTESKPVQQQIAEKPKSTPSPSPSPKPTPTPSPSPSPKPTPTPSPSPTPKPTPSETSTAKVTPTSVQEKPETDQERAVEVKPDVVKQAVASVTSSLPISPGKGEVNTIVSEKKENELTVAIAPKQKRRRIRKFGNEEPTKEVAPTPVTQTVSEPAPVTSVKTQDDVVAAVPRPQGFRRLEMGDYHYQRAMLYLNQGNRGQAIQELHIAALLDRRREEPVYQLGKLYKEEGQFEKAEKYFSHPVLRKKDEIKNWVKEMESQKVQTKKNQLTLNYGTGGALFLSLVMFGILRRVLQKRKVKQRVITAENIEELEQVLDSPVLKTKASSNINNRMDDEKITAPVKPVEVKVPEPMVEMFKPVEVKQPEPVASPPAPPEPVIPESVVTPPLPLPASAPATPPPLPVPTPEPVLIPEFRLDAAPLPSLEEVLTTATLVDEAMQRGNSFAMEGDADKARREYRTALALNPSHLDAHLGLAYLSFSQSQWDLALEHYIRALQISPNSAEVHYGIGRVFLETGRQDEAVPRFQAALKFDPTFEDARECLTSLGKAV